jgi:hypothetical protein
MKWEVKFRAADAAGGGSKPAAGFKWLLLARIAVTGHGALH